MDKNFEAREFVKELMKQHPLEELEEPRLIYKRQYFTNIEDIVNTIGTLNEIKYTKKYADHMLDAIKDDDVLNSLSEDTSERIKNLLVYAVNIASLTSSLLEIYVLKEQQSVAVDISNSVLGMFSNEIFLFGRLLIQASEIAVHKHSEIEDLSTLSVYFDFEENSLNVVNMIKEALSNEEKEES